MAENLLKRNCVINVEFKNHLYCYVTSQNRFIVAEIDKYFAKNVEGAWFSPQMKNGNWDGKKHFLTKLGRFPVGLLTELCRFAQTHDYKVEFANQYVHEKPGIDAINENFLKGIVLRPYQVAIVNKAIKYPLGIIKSATGTGKTEIIAALVKAYANIDLILVLVNQINLATQCVERMRKRGINDVGVIYGQEKDYNDRRVIVSTVQSIKNFPSIYKNAKMIVVDECKHASSDSFIDIIKASPATIRYGFDATPFENSRGKPTLEAFTIKQYLGDVVADLSSSDAIKLGILAKPTITMLTIQSKVDESIDYSNNYAQCYSTGIVNNEKRNNMIKFIVSKKPGKVLILIRQIEHGKLLQQMIPGAVFMHGGIKSKERTDVINQFNNNKVRVLIGSTIFDEGIDFSCGMDCLIMASGGKSYKKAIQRLGRALRQSEKGVVEVYDFFDKGYDALESHSESRLKSYKIEKYDVKVI